jgi:hypothetical protein
MLLPEKTTQHLQMPSLADLILNEWTNDKRQFTGWIVNNGVATVVKSAGLIVSKRQCADCQLHI